uniref:Uncharacterized protein n=1 Tax=Heterorhabditis bacteriophora TaxID=37862 RepID=A0A1I7WHW3_HETBA
MSSTCALKLFDSNLVSREIEDEYLPFVDSDSPHTVRLK